uniref:Ubiquitin-like protein 5 n=1 Tax=Meloidogyne enterolobii TaxID=390850 RepID=A0A6V7VMA5_MELEN|nr:unnamed protein product [Meloidogyne enterolobii]
MIEITVNDRLGKKVRVKCNATDKIEDLKKLIALQTGTRQASRQDRSQKVEHYLQGQYFSTRL